jgi:hypothetical protein
MSPSSSRAKRISLSKVNPSTNNEDETVSQNGSDELSEATTQEIHEYEGKQMITAFSHTEEDRLLENYTNPTYSPLKFNTIKNAPFTGAQFGLGYQRPRSPPKSKLIGLIELDNGAKVPMNELHNTYACKVLMTGLSQWCNSKKGSPEDFSKKVIIQELALLNQLGGYDPEVTTDRIRKAIHTLMLGFNSNVFDINREVESIAAHFMKMRIGDMPVEFGQLSAMNMAIDSYYERCGEDHKISQAIKYHGWRIMITLLINGHLAHNKIEPIPFSPIKDVDEQSYKATRIQNSQQLPFYKKGTMIEANKAIIKSYKAYLVRYDAHEAEKEAKRIASELAAPSHEDGVVHKKARKSFPYGND